MRSLLLVFCGVLFSTMAAMAWSGPVLRYKGDALELDNLPTTQSAVSDAREMELVLGSLNNFVLSKVPLGSQADRVDAFVKEQEKIARKNLEAPNGLRDATGTWWSFLDGFKLYRKHIKNGKDAETAARLAYDNADFGESPKPDKQTFQNFLNKYASSDESVKEFEAQLPRDVDEAIEKSSKSWREEGHVVAALDLLTSNVVLSDSDWKRAVAVAGRRPEIADLRTSSGLLRLKRTAAVQRFVIKEALTNSDFIEPVFQEFLEGRWEKKKVFYGSLFAE